MVVGLAILFNCIKLPHDIPKCGYHFDCFCFFILLRLLYDFPSSMNPGLNHDDYNNHPVKATTQEKQEPR